jgi:hypothetical protein
VHRRSTAESTDALAACLPLRTAGLPKARLRSPATLPLQACTLARPELQPLLDKLTARLSALLGWQALQLVPGIEWAIPTVCLMLIGGASC